MFGIVVVRVFVILALVVRVQGDEVSLHEVIVEVDGQHLRLVLEGFVGVVRQYLVVHIVLMLITHVFSLFLLALLVWLTLLVFDRLLLLHF